MANEAKNKNEVGNEVTESALEASVPNALINDSVDFIDPFADRRSKSDDEDAAPQIAPEETEKLFVTKIPLYHFLSQNTSTGRSYHNIRTAWKQKIKREDKIIEKEIELNLSVKTSQKYGAKSLYDLLDIIYGDTDVTMLEIVRREFVMDSGPMVTWTPQVSYTDEDGIKYTCPLRPTGDGDKAIWNLLLSILAKNNVISGYSSI